MYKSLGVMLERVAMILLFFIASSVLFIIYTQRVEHDYVTDKTHRFLNEALVDGVLSDYEFIEYQQSLAYLNSGYSVELVHTKYIDTPYYGFYNKFEIDDYYSSRNVLKPLHIEYVPIFTETDENRPTGLDLKIQDIRNLDILSAVDHNTWLPLPKDDADGEIDYSSIQPYQKYQIAYDKEELSSLVRLIMDKDWEYLSCVSASLSYNGINYSPSFVTVDLTCNGDGSSGCYKEHVGYSHEVNVCVLPRTVQHSISIPVLDSYGNPALDENNNPIYKVNTHTDLVAGKRLDTFLGNWKHSQYDDFGNYQCLSYHTESNFNSLRSRSLRVDDCTVCAVCATIPKEVIVDLKDTIVVGTPLNEIVDKVTIKYWSEDEKVIYDASVPGSAFPIELVSSYDKDYCGVQNTCFAYYDAMTQVQVTTVGGECLKCGGRCENRCAEDYKRNSICSDCAANSIPQFLGVTYIQEEVVTFNDILNALDTDNKYVLSRGDYVSIQIIQDTGMVSVPFLPEGATYVIRDGETIRSNGD